MNTSTFAGGIDNVGTISVPNDVGIQLSTVVVAGNTSLGGGITNTGTIVGRGIALTQVTDFVAGIDNGNGGLISSPNSSGIELFVVSTFAGGIVNGGKIAGQTGIAFTDDGTFGNAGGSGGIVNSGTISAGNVGIALASRHGGIGVSTFIGGIVNTGTISAGFTGIEVVSGVFSGGITNAGGGTVSAKVAVEIADATISGAIVDFGTIRAMSDGIAIGAGGEVLGGTAAFAIDIAGGTFTGGISNVGVISGSGGIDIAHVSGVSIFDGGAILASGGTAIEFAGSGNTLTLASGYTISGMVSGAGSETLQLGGSAAATFDLSNLGSTYLGFSTLEVTGGVWTLTGSGGGFVVSSGATIALTSGTDLTSAIVISSGGAVELLSGASTSGYTLRTGAILEIGSGYVYSSGVSGANPVEVLSAGTFSGGSCQFRRQAHHRDGRC